MKFVKVYVYLRMQFLKFSKVSYSKHEVFTFNAYLNFSFQEDAGLNV